MRAPAWFWVLTALNLVVLAPAIYMALATVAIVEQNDWAPLAVGIALLFCVLPVFCVAAPWAAWRALGRGRSSTHAAMQLGAPLVYAAFLVLFLMRGAP